MRAFRQSLRERWRMILSFSGFGALVALISFPQLYIYVSVLHIAPIYAKILEAGVSICLNFLLNHLITYRRVRGPFTWRSTARAFGMVLSLRLLITLPLNQVLFAALIALHVPYLLAQVICLAVTYLVNIFGHERYIYAGVSPVISRVMPVVSLFHERVRPQAAVIIPARNSARTIRAVLNSFLDQTYQNYVVIVVGNETGDNTEPIVREFEQQYRGKFFWGSINAQFRGRDAQAKRNQGVRLLEQFAPNAQIIFFTDSDNVQKPAWLELGIDALLQHHVHVVGGSMVSIARHEPGASFWDRFWGTFTDLTLIGKTPRIRRSYTLTADNFGLKGRMPFVTANMAITKEMLSAVVERFGTLFHESFTDSYEDYQAAWLLCFYMGAEIRMVSDERFANLHYHRLGFKNLRGEYFRSGKGCRRFIDWAPNAPLSQSRLRQANLVLSALSLGGVVLFASVVSLVLLLTRIGGPLALYGALAFPVLAGCAILGLFLLGALNILRARYLPALLFPALSLIFTVIYCFGMLSRSRAIARETQFAQQTTGKVEAVDVTEWSPSMVAVDTLRLRVVDLTDIADMETRRMRATQFRRPDRGDI